MTTEIDKQLSDKRAMEEASRLFKGYKCSHCGHQRFDVSYQNVHIGGEGDMRLPYCNDRETCWERWKEYFGGSNE